ncbi:SPBc2 prophage-derived glycosyltransferase SunS [Peptococcaceae bacterium CEB3]|nr:SPBc2 prophage-derived glycosyltransferase SunS [Peptococcaceae bacterium CEB3]
MTNKPAPGGTNNILNPNLSLNLKLSLSLCLITRDEEQSLPACLESIRDLAAEIIVVDTGSRDETIQIAAAAGARIFHFPWSGDFSAARNYALSQAHGDWVLVLDADERLQVVEHTTLRGLLDNEGADGYYLEIQNSLAPGLVSHDKAVRLFRNKPCYRFRGAIHEQIAPSILEYGGPERLACAPLVLLHEGYTPEKMKLKRKSERNIEILERELRLQPDDPFLLYCLGLEHYQNNQVGQGLAHLENALTHMPGGEGYLEDAVLYTALGYFCLGHRQKLESFIAQALLMFPEHPDLLSLRSLSRLNPRGDCPPGEPPAS